MYETASLQAEGSTIRVDGTCDDGAVTRLCAITLGALRAHPAGEVVVDLTRARSVTPAALAALLGVCAEDFDRVRLRGLSRHHERILRHLTPAGGRSRA
jgi:hypothetical protein